LVGSLLIYAPADIVNPLIADVDPSGAEDKLHARIVALNNKLPPPTIANLVGRYFIDSRGDPTVEVDVYAKYLNQVIFAARSSAPSGASAGSNEARELLDTVSPRYLGKGTVTAAANVTAKLSPALTGLKLCCIKAPDANIQEVDGTPVKENIGGNATAATSFALAEAGEALQHIQLFQYFAKNYFGCENVPAKFKLPSPFFNILNGGKHAGSNLKFQEFMVMPTRAAPYPDRPRIIAEVYEKLGGLLVKKYGVSAGRTHQSRGPPTLATPKTPQVAPSLRTARPASR
jgi:enolase